MNSCSLTSLFIAYRPKIDVTPSVDLAPLTRKQNKLVIWGRFSGEPLQQLLGRRESDGPCASKLQERPNFRMPIWAFEPASRYDKVYLNPTPFLPRNPLLAIYDRVIQALLLLGVRGQAQRDETTLPTIVRFDRRPPNKKKVFAIIVEGETLAYSLDFVRCCGDFLNLWIRRRNVVLAYQTELDGIGAFSKDRGRPVSEVSFGGHRNVGAYRAGRASSQGLTGSSGRVSFLTPASTAYRSAPLLPQLGVEPSFLCAGGPNP